MEALCNPMTSVQPSDTVSMCLKALLTLLDDAWTRMRLASDAQLTIELLNVLHRFVYSALIDCCALTLHDEAYLMSWPVE